jgi:hypothetical protein
MRILAFMLLAAAALDAQRFYADDPLEFEPPPRPVKDTKNRKLSDYFDLLNNQFRAESASRSTDRRFRQGREHRRAAEGVVGEAPLLQENDDRGIEARPGRTCCLPLGKWTVVSAKNEGVTPGFVLLDAHKRRFFIKFDPLTNPQMATSADAITSRFFHAMGFHVPDNNIIDFDPDQLVLGEDVSLPGRDGKPRKMTRRDLLEILLKVPKNSDGRYRARRRWSTR